MKHHLSIIALSFALAALTAPSAWADKGILQISTSPGDAKIYIDGKRKGNSPSDSEQAFIIQLKEGEYLVEVRSEIESDGKFKFENYAQKSIFVADDTIQSVNLELEFIRAVPGQSEAAESIAHTLQQLESDMALIPAGEFSMGDIQGGGYGDEKPVHRVSVSEFWLGKTEVTFDQWDACVASNGCSYNPDDQGWGRSSRPVISVSWEDITEQFIPWLSKTTGKQYRLPTEAEWEYAARAGSETKYSWGNSIGNNKANCDGCGSRWDDSQTAPVGSFSANAFGLYDMHGNVWEWTQDCWNKNYEGAPIDGSAWLSGGCSQRVLRGGSWNINPYDLRSASRLRYVADNRYYDNGFRLARTLD